MAMSNIYYIQDLESARQFIASNPSTDFIITNAPGSSRYYGMRVLDYMFKTLQAEFNNITDVIVDVGDDHSALFTAIKLQHCNIRYTGTSKTAKSMI